MAGCGGGGGATGPTSSILNTISSPAPTSASSSSPVPSGSPRPTASPSIGPSSTPHPSPTPTTSARPSPSPSATPRPSPSPTQGPIGPYHIATLAFDSYWSQGQNASAASVNQLLSYAVGNGKAVSDCHSGSQNCKAVFYKIG